MQGSYVLSRLEGNYEGLFSNDNGQLDPNITSKYDIPSLLCNGYGLLPNDRTHVLKLYGGYFFENIPPGAVRQLHAPERHPHLQAGRG